MKNYRSGTSLMLLALLCAFGADIAHAAVALNDGEWETTVEMKMEGMPFAMPPVKTTQCMTKDDPVPKQKDKESNCKMKDQKVAGNKVTWSMECIDRGAKSEMQGEITYAGDSYKGTMTMKTADRSGSPSTMTSVLSGRRIGACSGRSKQSVTVGGKEIPQVDPAQIEKAKQAQADYEKGRAANAARSAEFAKLAVPEEQPDACTSVGKELRDLKGCDTKTAGMALTPGEWEITAQTGTRYTGAGGQQDYQFGEDKIEKECLTAGSPIPLAIRENTVPVVAKIAPKRITWKGKMAVPGATTDHRGGVNYGGATLDGIAVITQSDRSGTTIETKTKVTGRRLGDGECVQQKRDFTAQKRSVPSAQDVKDATVNKLKGLFGR